MYIVKSEKAVYNRLLALTKNKKFDFFVKAEKSMQAILGYREYPKYVIVNMIGQLHNIFLELGEEFVKNERVDDSYHEFDLSLEQIRKERKDSSVDIQKFQKIN